MSNYDTDVLNDFKASFDDVTMDTPVEQIESAGRAIRRRRRIVGAAAGVAAVTGLALGVPFASDPSTAPPATSSTEAAGGVHIVTAAYTVDTQKNGSVRVTWDKQRYFSNHAALQKALRFVGFPVLIKDGEFCKGPHDSGTLDPSGVGPGVSKVMEGVRSENGRVTFVFTPAAMPAGKQLFIGYLTPSQLASVNGNPGSVERLVPATGPLTCTTQPPPAHIR